MIPTAEKLNYRSSFIKEKKEENNNNNNREIFPAFQTALSTAAEIF